MPRRGDTSGVQNQAVWASHARLAATRDSAVTLVRLGIDSGAGAAGHDVVLARYDFDPTPAAGDEYSITIGFDIGDVHHLHAGSTYALGPSGFPATATVVCLCPPLRPDSVRGSVDVIEWNAGQLTFRIAANLYFTEWADATRHAVYRLQQPLYAVRQ